MPAREACPAEFERMKKLVEGRDVEAIHRFASDASLLMLVMMVRYYTVNLARRL